MVLSITFFFYRKQKTTMTKIVFFFFTFHRNEFSRAGSSSGKRSLFKYDIFLLKSSDFFFILSFNKAKCLIEMHAFFLWLNKSIAFLFLEQLWYWHDIIVTCRLMHSTDWRMKALHLLIKRENTVVVVAFSFFICIARYLESHKDSIKSNVCCTVVMYLYGRCTPW